MVGHLGYIGELQVNGTSRPALGNDLYGSFGRDFGTKDGRRIMVIALTPRQWRGLGRATGLAEEVAPRPAPRLGADPGHRSRPLRCPRDAIAERSRRGARRELFSSSYAAFAGTGVLWGPFQDFATLVGSDPRCSPANPMFSEVEQPGIGPYLMPGLPLDFAASPREATRPAPKLGQDTDAVLGDVLGLSAEAIGKLHDQGVVAGVGGMIKDRHPGAGRDPRSKRRRSNT